MTLKGRLERVEKVAGPSVFQDSVSPDMRSVARRIAFVLHCSLQEPTGPAAEAALAIARALKSPEQKRA
jgi:hypothetical protein